MVNRFLLNRTIYLFSLLSTDKIVNYTEKKQKIHTRNIYWIRWFFLKNFFFLYSHISGITLLGVPSEIYSNGTQYLIIGLINVIVIAIIIYIYLPVFYELQLTSVYEASTNYYYYYYYTRVFLWIAESLKSFGFILVFGTPVRYEHSGIVVVDIRHFSDTVHTRGDLYTGLSVQSR